jgi:hypothetical protein
VRTDSAKFDQIPIVRGVRGVEIIREGHEAEVNDFPVATVLNRTPADVSNKIKDLADDLGRFVVKLTAGDGHARNWFGQP